MAPSQTDNTQGTSTQWNLVRLVKYEIACTHRQGQACDECVMDTMENHTPLETRYMMQDTSGPEPPVFHAQGPFTQAQAMGQQLQQDRPGPVAYPAAPVAYQQPFSSQQPASYSQWPISYAQQPVPYAQYPAPYAQQPVAYAQQPATYAQQPVSQILQTPYIQQPVLYGHRPSPLGQQAVWRALPQKPVAQGPAAQDPAAQGPASAPQSSTASAEVQPGPPNVTIAPTSAFKRPADQQASGKAAPKRRKKKATLGEEKSNQPEK